jgi:ABC-2 type transport system permease protein
MNSIQELLIAPLSAAEIVLGYVVSGILRAAIIATLILSVGALIVHTMPSHWGIYVAMMILVSTLFSTLGIVFGLIAERFDHIAALTTFVITPLVFIGGVFTSVRFLPPPVREISLVNPMFYMIDAFRYSYTSQSDVPLGVSIAVVAALTATVVAVALRMVASGYKLRG